MVTATFRFYEELNDFLAPPRRGHAFAYACARAATVKNAIEALGVPHTEVELILAQGRSVDFSHRVGEGERISVYPQFEAFDVRPLLRVRARPLREPRFLADAHLGGLARLLRMLGLDTRYDNHLADREIRALAGAEGRIILTRDRDLLICGDVSHGCYVHALRPEQQLREIVERLQLQAAVRPFTRCLRCNEGLEAVDKAQVLDGLPAAVAGRHTAFRRCPACGRVYWPGDHYRRMQAMLHDVLKLPVLDAAAP